ncbi:MAG: hypothetical protein CMP23_01145 [Rickettsiales bacterium]|nr:hypothetical protein [Rickettsiales bacterium]|tara:strand:+ start:830 stop:2917 length:2088 start_codon:yes stop_codon:yes gene_type:complete
MLLSLCAMLVALDMLVLWEPVSQQMDKTRLERPARVMGNPILLAPGAPATQKAWRSIWLAADYTEKNYGALDGPAQFAMTPGLWQVFPEDGELLEVAIQSRKVKSLRSVTRNQPVAGWSFPLAPLGLLGPSSPVEAPLLKRTDLPVELVNALLNKQDQHFYTHSGFDVLGSLKHRLSSLGQDQAVYRSTLTRQLARDMLAGHEPGWKRSAQELLVTLMLEQRYSKDEIFASWLQRVAFSNPAVGEQSDILSTAHQRFGADLAALSPAEISALATDLNRGSSRLPSTALQTSLRPRPAHPWLMAKLQAELGRGIPQQQLATEGFELRTTINPLLQDAARQTLSQGISELKESYPQWWREGPGPRAALIAMDPRTGAIRAMASSNPEEYGSSGPTTEQRHTAGTAFKAVVLAAAIGADWPQLGPSSEILDEPIQVFGAGLAETGNGDGTFLGRVSLKTATERSRRPPLVRLGLMVGPRKLVETARSLGISSELKPRLNLAIGEQPLTLLDLCVAYCTLANGGTRPSPQLLEGVRQPDGIWLERHMPNTNQAIDPRVASVVTTLLQGVIDQGTAHRVRDLGFRLPLAGSTGLSSDRRDAWMVGYTPDLVVALWLGLDSELGLQGAPEDVAVSSWTRFMLAAEPYLEGTNFNQLPGTELAGQPAPEQGTTELRKQLQNEDRQRRQEERRALQRIEMDTL